LEEQIPVGANTIDPTALPQSYLATFLSKLFHGGTFCCSLIGGLKQKILQVKF